MTTLRGFSWKHRTTLCKQDLKSITLHCVNYCGSRQCERSQMESLKFRLPADSPGQGTSWFKLRWESLKLQSMKSSRVFQPQSALLQFCIESHYSVGSMPEPSDIQGSSRVYKPSIHFFKSAWKYSTWGISGRLSESRMPAQSPKQCILMFSPSWKHSLWEIKDGISDIKDSNKRCRVSNI